MRYAELANVYESIQNTPKRLEKTLLISSLLKKTPDKELDIIFLLIEGKIFHYWQKLKLGVAAKTVVKAISIATGIGFDNIEKEWRNYGDLGLVAEKLISQKIQTTLFSSELTVEKVYSNISKLGSFEGTGTVDRKVKLLAELLTSAKPLEARYIVRTALEDLRVGVGEGLLRDSIVWAFFKEELGLEYDRESNKLLLPDNKRQKYDEYVNAVQYALNIKNDFAQVSKIAKSDGLEGLVNVKVTMGKPMKTMLFQKAKNIEEAFEIVGLPAAFEYKYDGFRVQVHFDRGSVLLFTRRQEDVTAQFPDVVKSIKENIKADSAILDTEIVGFNPKTNQYVPFQNISQRIKRKYDIEKIRKEFPVEVNVFDIMFLNGENKLELPFQNRRKLISEILEPKEREIVLSRIIVTDKKEEASVFYNEALDRGEEGVMAKNLQASYKPGSRVGYGVKIKPVMESLELVIVKAEWGEGKRATWLTSFTLAARSDEGLLEVGKVSTGFKELEGEGVTFNRMTELLRPLILAEKGKEVRVKPEVVIEVSYEEVQSSPTYSSGYALRFPRFLRIREERAVDDIDDLETIGKLYKGQRNREKI